MAVAICRYSLDRPALTLLQNWAAELTHVRILDPACGSGNFLYLALKRLLDLWHEARVFGIEHGLTIAVDPIPHPSQLYGIEIDFYAHEIASIVVWIGFLQWKHDHGIKEEKEPLLEVLSNIEHADAILRYDPEGKPYEPEWPQADYIIGNPPFLGDKRMRGELGDTYVDDLRKLYNVKSAGGTDFVTFWFDRARSQIAAGDAKRAGLLATNSIRMIGNRPVLQRILDSGGIFMAWSNRPWSLEGASVRVSLIGFDDGSQTTRTLDGEAVDEIHADLSAVTNVTRAQRLDENSHLTFKGITMEGPFDLKEKQAAIMLSAPLNPNGRPNADVVKERLSGRDVAQRTQKKWLIDFGERPEAEAALYEMPFEYVRQVVKPIRDLNHRQRTRERWWLHGENRPGLRKALNGLARCIVTPGVSKHRIFVWMDTGVVPDQKLCVIPREDDYFMGVLQSRIHESWSLATCSWTGVGNDPSYNSDTTFDTFPFPWPPGTEPSEAESPHVRAIAEAARELVRLRDNWLNPPRASEADLKHRTLTKLYNDRVAGKATWLDNLHRTLDEAVFAAYGWPPNLTKQEILARLLALNHERAAAQPATTPRRAKAARPSPSPDPSTPASSTQKT